MDLARRLTAGFTAALLATVVAVAAGTAASAAPHPLHVVDLGTLRGHCCSYALAINNAGDVVGFSAPPNHAFLWHRGHLTDLGTLGGHSSVATAINDWGDIAGYSQLPDGSTHSVWWHHGHIQDLNIPGGGYPHGINNSGVIVGITSVDNSGTGIGFRWHAGVTTLLVTKDGTKVLANAINDRDQIAGTLRGTELDPPVRLYSGAATVLTTHSGQGQAINNRGDVAGVFYSGTEHLASTDDRADWYTKVGFELGKCAGFRRAGVSLGAGVCSGSGASGSGAGGGHEVEDALGGVEGECGEQVALGFGGFGGLDGGADGAGVGDGV